MMNSSIRVTVWLICIIVVLHSSSTVFSKEKSSLHHGLYLRQWRDICLHTRCYPRRRSSRGKKRHFREVFTAFVSQLVYDAIVCSFIRNKSQRKEMSCPAYFLRDSRLLSARIYANFPQVVWLYFWWQTLFQWSWTKYQDSGNRARSTCVICDYVFSLRVQIANAKLVHLRITRRHFDQF